MRNTAMYILYITENSTTKNTELLLRDKMSLEIVQTSADDATYWKQMFQSIETCILPYVK